MRPGQLNERDGAALLRERVQQAVRESGDKPLTDRLRDAVPYGDHQLQLTAASNPTTLKIDCGVRCRKCGWYFRSSVDLLVGASKPADEAVLEGTFYRLLRGFVTEVDQDCKTASLMAVVTAVHDY
jgi:hypothetical protein